MQSLTMIPICFLLSVVALLAQTCNCSLLHSPIGTTLLPHHKSVVYVPVCSPECYKPQSHFTSCPDKAHLGNLPLQEHGQTYQAHLDLASQHLQQSQHAASIEQSVIGHQQLGSSIEHREQQSAIGHQQSSIEHTGHQQLVSSVEQTGYQSVIGQQQLGSSVEQTGYQSVIGQQQLGSSVKQTGYQSVIGHQQLGSSVEHTGHQQLGSSIEHSGQQSAQLGTAAAFQQTTRHTTEQKHSIHHHGSGVSHQVFNQEHQHHPGHQDGDHDHGHEHEHHEHHEKDKNIRYNFEYYVNDRKTGDVKRQKEERQGDAVNGEYSLLEEDGNVRTVKYYADWKSGFHAQIHNSKPKTA